MSDPTERAVRLVRINRPERRNAIDSDTAARLHDELLAFEADDTAGVAVLTGDEQAFCAGARFGCLERRWGVPLVDGGTYRLPRIVGLGRALELILTGREFDASEAFSIGFANRVVPSGSALAEAVELAEAIAEVPWNCLVHDRLSVYEGLGLELDDALANEDRHGREVIFDPGFAEGLARFGSHQAERREAGDR